MLVSLSRHSSKFHTSHAVVYVLYSNGMKHTIFLGVVVVAVLSITVSPKSLYLG